MAQSTYLPVGPQQNVPVSTVTNGGWTECYRDTYDTTGNSWSAIQSGCSGDRLMLACRATGSSTLQLLAQAPSADVLTDTGTDYVTVHSANGTDWYWNNNYSWGFAKAGDAVFKNQCDTSSSPGNDTRLCWHTLDSGSGNIYGGYRCGSDAGLNSSSAFERIIYVQKAGTALTQSVPGLSQWGLLLLALCTAVAGFVFQSRRTDHSGRTGQ